MSLHNLVVYTSYRQALLFHSYKMARIAVVLREKFNISNPIDPDIQIDDDIPIFPDSPISKVLEVKYNQSLKELARRMRINHKLLIRFLLNDEKPRITLKNTEEEVIKDRLIAIHEPSQLDPGLYIRIDDSLSQSALIELTKIAKERFKTLYSRNKRMQTSSDHNQRVYFDLNKIMIEIWKNQAIDQEFGEKSNTTIFNQALNEYTDTYFENQGQIAKIGEDFTEKLEQFRQEFIKVEKSYQFPNNYELIELLLNTTHKA